MTAVAVFRCSGHQTLRLAEVMREVGVASAWAPEWWRRVRLSRRRKVARVCRPLLPTFLFVEEQDLSQIPNNAKALNEFSFGPFIVNATAVFVKPHELAPLREEEQSLREGSLSDPTVPDYQTFLAGTAVVMEKGPLAGVGGIVVSQDRSYCRVDLNNKLQVKVPAFMLQEVA